MVKKLIVLFLSVVVGTFLAFFAVLLLQDYNFLVCGAILILVFGGWFLWIARGGLKKNRAKKPQDY